MITNNILRCSRCVFRYVGMPKIKTKNKWGNICFKKDKYCQEVARSCSAPKTGYNINFVKKSNVEELKKLKRGKI